MRESRRRLIVGAASLVTLALAGGYAAAQAPRVIAVKAKKFTFTPDKITLKKGEPVVFELSTEDVLMGFSLPDFKLRADIVPGKTVQLAFTPDKAGEFDFICDVFCGDLHEDMGGKLTVV
jgi:cytochrome c oxidase subunit 2